MNKIAKLKKELAESKAAGLAIVKAAEAEDRELTEEEAAEFEKIEGKVAKLTDDIKAAEDLAGKRRQMEGSTSLTPAGHTTVHDQDPALTGGFKDIGEFAVAVHGAVQASQVGGAVDTRLIAMNGHQGGGDAGEGYSLPPQYRDQVWDLVNEFDEFGPLIDEEPTARREVKLNADETTPWGSAGIKAYWRAEGTKMEPSELADEGRNVPLHELYTLATATEELLEDAPRLNNRLTRKAAEAIAYKKNLAIVDGTGVGQPLGWMNSSALIAVAKESSQPNRTILPLNLLNMYSRLMMMPGSSPFWLINQDTLPQLMTMTIGDRPIWMPPAGLAAAPGGSLLGLPVRFSEFAETLGEQGDVQLVNPRGYYGVRRSSGLKFATSIHLYFDYNRQAFRWVFRYGGQPHLSKPVKPAKSAATRSHFVTLAERK